MTDKLDATYFVGLPKKRQETQYIRMLQELRQAKKEAETLRKRAGGIDDSEWGTDVKVDKPALYPGYVEQHSTEALASPIPVGTQVEKFAPPIC